MGTSKLLYAVDLTIFVKLAGVLVKAAEGLYYTYHAGEILMHDFIHKILPNNWNSIVLGVALLGIVLIIYKYRWGWWHIFMKDALGKNNQVLTTKNTKNITDKNILYYGYMQNNMSPKEIAKKEKVKIQTAKKNVQKVKVLIRNKILKEIK